MSEFLPPNPPTPENGYTVRSEMEMTAELFNSILGSIHARITACEALESAGSGVGQAWQDVTTSRSAGTVFRNTSGRPIQLAIKGAANGAGELAVSTDGAEWLYLGGGLNSDVSFPVVPAGHYYRLASGGFLRWMELR